MKYSFLHLRAGDAVFVFIGCSPEFLWVIPDFYKLFQRLLQTVSEDFVSYFKGFYELASAFRFLIVLFLSRQRCLSAILSGS